MKLRKKLQLLITKNVSEKLVQVLSKIPAKCSKIESNNICHTCDIRFTLYKDLIRHNESVHEEKKHECPICSQKFCRSDNLKRHIKELHMEK